MSSQHHRHLVNAGVAILFATLTLVGCTDRQPAGEDPSAESRDTGTPADMPDLPPGEPVAAPQFARVMIGVYFLPGPAGDPVAVARAWLAENCPKVVIDEDGESNENIPADGAVAKIELTSAEKLPPPDVESLGYFGRGLDPAQIESLQQARDVFTLMVRAPGRQWPAVVPCGDRLAHHVAVQCGGLIWDAETREMFSPAAWQERRLEGWDGSSPRVPYHITIHGYPVGGTLRAVTLGMARFGQPDVVVNDFPRNHSGPVQALINVACQALVENGGASITSPLSLDLRAISNPHVRRENLESLEEGAETRIKVAIGPAEPDQGDPDNPLLEIRFPAAASGSRYTEMGRVLSTLFGARESFTGVRHDDEELEAASRRAVERLLALKPRFQAGLEPGERLLIKAPFATPDGENEWMWVEVLTWQGSQLEGILMNEPYLIPSLKAGSEVTIKETDLYDYMLHHADGTMEGNETGKVIERLQAAGETVDP